MEYANVHTGKGVLRSKSLKTMNYPIDDSSFFVGNLGTSAGVSGITSGPLLTTTNASTAVYTSAASLLNN